MENAKFSLGQTVTTPNALDTLNQEDVRLCLGRHMRGDWGDVCPEDASLNDEALKAGDRLLSVYGNGERRFWIITEWDRSVTTILMPEDY